MIALAVLTGALLLSPPDVPETTPEAGGKPPLEVTGRVYARESFEPAGRGHGPTAPWNGRFSLASARIGARYRGDGVSIELDTELADRPRVKDAFARIEGSHGLSARAGQFDTPFARLAVESTWKLPIVDRTRLDRILLDRLQVAGRRPGASLAWRRDAGVAPRIEAGVWQGVDTEGRSETDPPGPPIEETAGLRASVSPGGLDAGIAGGWRSVQPSLDRPFERFWFANADLSIESKRGGRAWAEGGAGASWADEDPLDATHATFGWARALVAWRLGGAGRGTPFVEAFGGAGVLDPDTEVRRDLIAESTVGVNAGRWKRWRGQIQIGNVSAARNAPRSLIGSRARSERAVLAQIGVSL